MNACPEELVHRHIGLWWAGETGQQGGWGSGGQFQGGEEGVSRAEASWGPGGTGSRCSPVVFPRSWDWLLLGPLPLVPSETSSAWSWQSAHGVGHPVPARQHTALQKMPAPCSSPGLVLLLWLSFLDKECIRRTSNDHLQNTRHFQNFRNVHWPHCLSM